MTLLLQLSQMLKGNSNHFPQLFTGLGIPAYEKVLLESGFENETNQGMEN